MGEVIESPEAYFSEMLPERDEFLRELEFEALRESIPIVGPVVGKLLELLVRTSGAREVLELGTATGYSAIFLARGLVGEGARLITLEQDPVLAARARENLAHAGLASCVDVQCTPALSWLQARREPVDLAFLDIEKDQYLEVFPELTRLVRPGGLLVCDNVAMSDALGFNARIQEDPRWDTLFLLAHLPLHSPHRDALCLARRREHG
jgi:predicted O-methyltransferase YrrM